MRTDKNIIQFLNEANLDQIASYIDNNRNSYTKYTSIICNRLMNIRPRISPRDINECSVGDINSCYIAIMSKPFFIHADYEILQRLTNYVYFPKEGTYDTPSDQHIGPITKVFALACLDKERVIHQVYEMFEEDTERVLRYFYQAILDIYIPFDNPELIIDILESKTSLSEMIKNAYVREYMKEKCDRYKYAPMKELILFHNIISDIYNNEDACYDFLREYHKLNHGSYHRKEIADQMTKKYQKYMIHDDRFDLNASFIHSLYFLFEIGFAPVRGDAFSTTDHINNFLHEFAWRYQKLMPIEVFKCLLMDIQDSLLKEGSADWVQYRKESIRYIMNELLTKWNMKEFSYAIEGMYIDETFELSIYDTPISDLEELDQLANMDLASESSRDKHLSAKMNSGEKKIYKAYKTYKNAEEKVDTQITKAANGIKGVLTGDVREEIIEGKKFSAIELLKKLLAGVAIFSYSKIHFVVLLVIRFALKKKTTDSERKKILMEIDTELEMLDEKIKDARGDNNREAKYAMMRTRKELQNAKTRITYGMTADRKSLSDTRKQLDNSRAERTV